MAAIEAEVMLTHCKRCKGQLTAKQSMRRGYGPVCAKKVKYGQSADLIRLLSKPIDLNSEENFMDELEKERRKAI